MATIVGKKVDFVSEPETAGVGSVADELAAEETLLAELRDYIDRNGLRPEIFRVSAEESRRNGTDRMTMEEIDQVIQLARADRKG